MPSISSSARLPAQAAKDEADVPEKSGGSLPKEMVRRAISRTGLGGGKPAESKAQHATRPKSPISPRRMFSLSRKGKDKQNANDVGSGDGRFPYCDCLPSRIILNHGRGSYP